MGSTPQRPDIIDELRRMSLELDQLKRSQGVGGPGGPGATDHGALTGLADDDHPQYHTDARAAAWLAGFDTFTGKDTDDLPEGSSNLYYTNGRADARIAAAALSSLADRDHADLTNFDASDDHAQYARLAGRDGGQTIHGGDSTGESITIHPNLAEDKTGLINLKGRIAMDMSSYFGTPGTLFNIFGAMDITGTIRILERTGVITYTGFAGTPFVLFSVVGAIRTDDTARSMGAGQVLNFAPSYELHPGSNHNTRLLIDNVTHPLVGLRINSVNNVGGDPEFVTHMAHGWTTGDTVTIRNSTVPAYNGTGHVITVTATDKFTVAALTYSATATGRARKTAGAGSPTAGNTSVVETTVDILGSFDEGWAVTAKNAVALRTFTGNGPATSITTLTGMLLESNAGKATNLRSIDAHLDYLGRHGGRLRVGAQSDPVTTLDVRGGISLGFVAKTAAYTVTRDDALVLVSAPSGSYDITLPAANAPGGQLVVVWKTDAANTVSVKPGAGDSLVPTNPIPLAAANDKAVLISDGGTSWKRLI